MQERFDKMICDRCGETEIIKHEKSNTEAKWIIVYDENCQCIDLCPSCAERYFAYMSAFMNEMRRKHERVRK